MNKIKVSLDEEGFREKPTDGTIGAISNRIGASIVEFNPTDDMKMFALLVGRAGYTFCPATFKDGNSCLDPARRIRRPASRPDHYFDGPCAAPVAW